MFSQIQNSPYSDDGRNVFEQPLFTTQPAAVARQLILLVEDNADSRDMLRTLLEMWRYRVIEARDGEEAVALAQGESPSVILMDVGIPVVDGMEATRRIRQFAAADKMPVVFISGYAHPRYRLAAMASGGNEYLVKPLDFQELETVLDKYIKNRETIYKWSE